MTALTWAGTVAGALIAVGTLLRWAVRRAIRFGTWAAAAVRLPTVVDDLAHSVTALSASVTTLSSTISAVHPRIPEENPRDLVPR